MRKYLRCFSTRFMQMHRCLYNTPPAYGIYICGKVFKWLKKMGGLEVMKQRNEEKAKILYDFLDDSKLFKGTVRKEDRSLMNVPFVTGNEELDAKFVKEAKEAGLENLKGHQYCRRNACKYLQRYAKSRCRETG